MRQTLSSSPLLSLPTFLPKICLCGLFSSLNQFSGECSAAAESLCAHCWGDASFRETCLSAGHRNSAQHWVQLKAASTQSWEITRAGGFSRFVLQLLFWCSWMVLHAHISAKAIWPLSNLAMSKGWKPWDRLGGCLGQPHWCKWMESGFYILKLHSFLILKMFKNEILFIF